MITINLLKFKLRAYLNSNNIKNKVLKDFFHSIKKDRLSKHDYSLQNKNPVKINKNILYLNHFFNDSHFQIKYDLTNKRDTVIRVKSVTKEDKIDTTFEQSFSDRNEIVALIKKLSR